VLPFSVPTAGVEAVQFIEVNPVIAGARSSAAAVAAEKAHLPFNVPVAAGAEAVQLSAASPAKAEVRVNAAVAVERAVVARGAAALRADNNPTALIDIERRIS
jgi:hypothetical protein